LHNATAQRSTTAQRVVGDAPGPGVAFEPRMSNRRSSKKAARTAKAKSAQNPMKPLSSKEQKTLGSLDSRMIRAPDAAVRHVLDEAGELKDAATSKAEALLKNSKLKAGFDKQLHAAQDMLHRAETIWSMTHTKTASEKLIGIRKEAETLKTGLIDALRYFKKDDAALLEKLDAIGHGTGDADLIEDMRKLAGLASEHAVALKKAKKLPPKVVQATNKLADSLSAAIAEIPADTDSQKALELRNRAYWNLRLVMDEVRAAGRYVFSNDKRALKQFRHTMAGATKTA